MTLHGFCTSTTCSDNGVITPAFQNPLTAFGFNRSPASNSGLETPDFELVLLSPTNLGATFGSYTASGGVATSTMALSRFSTTAFSNPNEELATYLTGSGPTGGPSDKLSAFQAGQTNQGFPATSFFVYTADFGSVNFATAVSITDNVAVPQSSEYLGLVTCSASPASGDSTCPFTGAVQDGTAPSSTIIVVPAPVIGHGFLVLLAIGGVLLGGKLFENLKKHKLHAA